MEMDLSLVPYGSEFVAGGGDRKYGECLRNHAAAIGGHAFDGCGEFMPAGGTEALKCAACGCHRNFHRRDDPSAAAQRRLPPPPGFHAAFLGHHLPIVPFQQIRYERSRAGPDTPPQTAAVVAARARKRCRAKLRAEQKETIIVASNH